MEAEYKKQFNKCKSISRVVKYYTKTMVNDQKQVFELAYMQRLYELFRHYHIMYYLYESAVTRVAKLWEMVHGSGGQELYPSTIDLL